MITCLKCGTEYEPSGNHDEDSGERECEVCKFKFIVRIEYDPEYYEYCVNHKFGVFKPHRLTPNEYEYRFCEYCNKYETRKANR